MNVPTECIHWMHTMYTMNICRAYQSKINLRLTVSEWRAVNCILRTAVLPCIHQTVQTIRWYYYRLIFRVSKSYQSLERRKRAHWFYWILPTEWNFLHASLDLPVSTRISALHSGRWKMLTGCLRYSFSSDPSTSPEKHRRNSVDEHTRENVWVIKFWSTFGTFLVRAHYTGEFVE